MKWYILKETVSHLIDIISMCPELADDTFVSVPPILPRPTSRRVMLNGSVIAMREKEEF